MNLNYSITTGKITQDDGTVVATGWSGNNANPTYNPSKVHGKNNPAMTKVRNIGSLPVGVYSVGAWGDHPPLGKHSALLTQISGETYGRSGFAIHGPSSKIYGEESRGCIVVPHDPRLEIEALKPDTVTVTE